MSESKFNRRKFLKRAAVVAGAGLAGAAATGYFVGGQSRVSRAAGKKVIVIGIDGMDPGLAQLMMNETDGNGRSLLPNLRKLHFSRLGTSTPPQSPVAWATFINGAGPGSHGVFDFVHRHPHEPTGTFYGASEIVPGEGAWEVGDYDLPLDFWPFNHRPAKAELRRQGTPFWDFLDTKGVPTTFYDLPCNYPPSPSKHGYHRCIAGMGTPDMLGTYGTCQHFAENGPEKPESQGGVKKSKLDFKDDTARAVLEGPQDSLRVRRDGIPLKPLLPIEVEFLAHRDPESNAAVIDIQGKRLLLRAGEWSPWTTLDFHMSTPWFVPSQKASGICRFYLQEVTPNFRLYVTPINIDPANPAVQISEPSSFIQEAADKLGLFYTAGFQEDYEARKYDVFSDDEFIRQADKVLEERLALFEYAVKNYDDGLLFFYFSSSDLQSHILWWNSNDTHPSREEGDARDKMNHVRRLYQRLDTTIGDIVDRYGSQATIVVMSDHGFANFRRQFNLNTWLRFNNYLPADCESLHDADWSKVKAYGLGLNGLYLNLKGREQGGQVEPGAEREALLRELTAKLEAQDDDGAPVIRKVYRSDEIYKGSATALAPDLIIGYERGYRAAWDTIQGGLTDQFLLDNDMAWSADHCADASVVPGVLFSNRPIQADNPGLVDMAPSILAKFGVDTPATMVGRNVLG
jgi:predicted AlkP superfamily phosphohydrolase/phosphomutase